MGCKSSNSRQHHRAQAGPGLRFSVFAADPICYLEDCNPRIPKIVNPAPSDSHVVSRPNAALRGLAASLCPGLICFSPSGCVPELASPGKIIFDLWYNVTMTTKLSKELSDALNASGTSQIEAVDPTSGRVYFIVDGDTHRQAMEALRQRQDRDAIAEGIAQMEAGQGKPLNEAFEDMRGRLGFPQQT